MRLLPNLPEKIDHRQLQIIRARGINYTDNYASGDLAECNNVTLDRYPLLSTRKGRNKREILKADYTFRYMSFEQGSIVNGVETVAGTTPSPTPTTHETRIRTAKFVPNDLFAIFSYGTEFYDSPDFLLFEFCIIAYDANGKYIGYDNGDDYKYSFGTGVVKWRTNIFFSDIRIKYPTYKFRLIAKNQYTQHPRVDPEDYINAINNHALVMYSTYRSTSEEAVENISTIYEWDNKLLTIADNNIYFDGKEMRGFPVSDAEKQICVVNKYMVIYPDKIFLNWQNGQTINMSDYCIKGVRQTGGDYTRVNFISNYADSGYGCIEYKAFNDANTGEEIREKYYFPLKNIFAQGKKFAISGCKANENNNINVTAVNVFVDAEDAYPYDLIFRFIVDTGNNTFTDATELLEELNDSSKIEFQSRDVPKMDFVCSYMNRLFGCCSEDHYVYCSAAGEPFTFYDETGASSTDSWGVQVGSDDDFTACCKQGSSVLFCKENTIHKLVGGYPGEFYLYEYNFDGPAVGCENSVKSINETIIYLGRKGVYTFQGSSPVLISDCFGEKRFKNGRAGTDGIKYYLSAQDENDEWNLLVFDTRTGMWVKEDNTEVKCFAEINDDLYFTDGDYLINLETKTGNGTDKDDENNETEIEWNFRFTPFIETVSGSYNSNVSIFAKKRYTRLILRYYLAYNSKLKMYIREDNGEWRLALDAIGEGDELVTKAVAINRCDKFEIKFEGDGYFSLSGIERIFVVGSAR